MTVEELLNSLRPYRLNPDRRAAVTTAMHKLDRLSFGTPVDENISVNTIISGEHTDFEINENGVVVAKAPSE